MSELLSTSFRYHVLAILICLMGLSQDAISSSVTKEHIENRVIHMNSSIELRYTPEVQKRIDFLTVKQKDAAASILGRVSMYFPLFEKVLREKGLPDDLKYLAAVESGLSPHATSHAGAAGLWQFMKPTARMHGLKISRVIDERRDPLKSTYAAAEYLEYLYKRFGDWTLAIAAYNCGPGNVRKAIKRSGGKTSYWEIQKYLPRETRNYIPKFIAYSYVMNYYYDHDIIPEMVDNKLIYTASARVFDKVSLGTLSKNIGIDYDIVKLLNPEYVRGYIPTNDGRYILTLPEQEMYDYANQNNIDLYYHDLFVKKVEVAETTEVPQSKPSRTEVISPSKLNAVAIGNQSSSQGSDKLGINHRSHFRPYKTHVIQKKESLKDIALRENVDLKDLIVMNNISDKNPPKMGDVIRIYR